MDANGAGALTILETVDSLGWCLLDNDMLYASCKGGGDKLDL